MYPTYNSAVLNTYYANFLLLSTSNYTSRKQLHSIFANRLIASANTEMRLAESVHLCSATAGSMCAVHRSGAEKLSQFVGCVCYKLKVFKRVQIQIQKKNCKYHVCTSAIGQCQTMINEQSSKAK
jgi:hypothetical protein